MVLLKKTSYSLRYGKQETGTEISFYDAMLSLVNITQTHSVRLSLTDQGSGIPDKNDIKKKQSFRLLGTHEETQPLRLSIYFF